MEGPSEKADDLLANLIEIETPGMLVDVAKSLCEFLDKGLIKEVSSGTSLRDIKGVVFLEDLINFEFVTVPGGTKHLLSCETDRGLVGAFRKL